MSEINPEKPKLNTLPTAKEIQDETFWLLDRQTEHAATMDELGITEKAKAKLSDHDAAMLNDMSRPSISLSHKSEEDGTRTKFLNVRFATPSFTSSGHNYNSTGFVYAPVLEVTGDAISIEPEFTLLEAEAMIDMATGLKEAKALGVLPHLAGSLDHINNPLTAMTAAPPRTRSPIQ